MFYVLFPVVGPMFAFGTDGQGFQVGDYWPNVRARRSTSRPEPMSFDSATPRNCMPAMHTAWALSLFIHTRQGAWWLRPAAARSGWCAR